MFLDDHTFRIQLDKIPPAADLYVVADRILAEIPRDKQAPHYRDETFRRKLITAQRREIGSESVVQQEPAHALLMAEWDSILHAAKLTPRQREVVEMRIIGMTFESIGEKTACTKQAILNVLQQAAKKISASREQNQLSGLHEVYRSETKRGLPHSRPGRIHPKTK